MKISGLIKVLQEKLNEYGDIEILAFHHEGGNSLRAYPGEITEESIINKDNKFLIIGGPFK